MRKSLRAGIGGNLHDISGMLRSDYKVKKD